MFVHEPQADSDIQAHTSLAATDAATVVLEIKTYFNLYIEELLTYSNATFGIS
jgi:hypothetical protein